MTAARATVFILPVHRRAWLWHARLDAAAGDAAVGAAASSSSSALSPAAPRPRWQDGATLEDKVELAGDQLAAWTHAKLAAQWAALAAAPEKSIKGRVFRAAQAVLARERPVASFCRSLPAWAPASRTVGGGHGGGGPPLLTLVHPPCVPARLARRRTRALVAAARPALARRAVGWSLAVLPLIPTLLTPLPAAPLYYCVWKAYSAAGALRGANTLARALAASDAAQLAAAREAIAAAAAAGFSPPPGSWADALARTTPGVTPPSSSSSSGPYLDLLDTADARIAAHYHGPAAAAALAPVWAVEEGLSGVDCAAVRRGEALPDALVAGLEAALPAPGLLAAVARVRKASAGAAFPSSGPAVLGAGGGPPGGAKLSVPPPGRPGLAGALDGEALPGGVAVARRPGQCPSPPAAA